MLPGRYLRLQGSEIAKNSGALTLLEHPGQRCCAASECIPERSFLALAGREDPDLAGGGNNPVAQGDALRRRFGADNGIVNAGLSRRPGKERSNMAVFAHA